MKDTQYITDKKGRKISVLLPVRKYKKMLEDLEELEDIRLYDQLRSKSPKYIAASKVFRAIDAKRSS